MADLQFPDLGNALLAGSQAAYYGGRARHETEAERRRTEAQPFIEPAVRGDPGAFAKVAAGDPATAVAVAQALQRMDANTLAKAKAATDYTTGVTTGLLASPAGDRERLYQQTLIDAQAKGMDTSRWPKNYDPAWVQMQHGYGIGAKAWFEEQGKNARHNTPGGGGGIPTQIDLPAPGAAPPAPVAAPRAGPPRTSAVAPGLTGSAPPLQQAAAVPAPGATAPLEQDNGPVSLAAPPDLKDGPKQPKRTGPVFEEEPTQYGYVQRGTKDKFGNVTPQVIEGGYLVFRNPQTNEHVLWKPRQTERSQPPQGFRWAPNLEGQELEPIPGGPTDPAVAGRMRVPPGFRQGANGDLEFIPGGPADPSVARRASPMNNEQARDAGFADRMQVSNAVLSTLDTQGTKFWERLSEKVQTGAGTSYGQSDEFQKFKQAKADFVNAQLRRESGAAISPDEFKKADAQYFPQPGDSAAVIEQKRKNRQLAVEGMIRGGGPSYKPSDSVTAPAQAKPNPADLKKKYGLE